MSNSSEVQERPDWILATEACDLLGISDKSLKKLVKEGFLRAYRIKGIQGFRFKKSDVLALIEEVNPTEFEE